MEEEKKSLVRFGVKRKFRKEKREKKKKEEIFAIIWREKRTERN